MNRKIAIVALCSILLNSLYAAENPNPETPKTFNHAININPLGLALGAYGGNYELLLGQTHGIVLEAAYSSTKASSGSDDATVKGGGGGIQYRWHWSNAMQSGFLGVFVRYSSATGTGVVTTTSGSITTKSNFDVSMSGTTIGLNIGKRWVWDNGINIAARIGYGYTNLNLSTTSSNTDVNKFINDLKPILQAVAGFDAELSVGYAF